jgi:prepilin-type N-terminal cleavage/methylation domain-containing protein
MSTKNPLHENTGRRASSARHQSGFTLVEVLIASTISLILAAILAVFFLFSLRSFAAMTNYADMNQKSELALDKMSKDIRQARSLTAFSTNSLTFLDVNNNSLQYTFDSTNGTLVRISGGVTTTYLTNCDSLQFWIYQHTPISNTFDCYIPSGATNARVIQVTWHCSRKILGTKATTESVESATLSLRNH